MPYKLSNLYYITLDASLVTLTLVNSKEPLKRPLYSGRRMHNVLSLSVRPFVPSSVRSSATKRVNTVIWNERIIWRKLMTQVVHSARARNDQLGVKVKVIRGQRWIWTRVSFLVSNIRSNSHWFDLWFAGQRGILVYQPEVKEIVGRFLSFLRIVQRGWICPLTEFTTINIFEIPDVTSVVLTSVEWDQNAPSQASRS